MDSFLQQEEAANVHICSIVVQTARDVSEAVAKQTGVRHESPQLLFIRNGQCVHQVSHRSITANAIKDALK